jgi:spore coat protein U domain-containing protein, fimbrial subunit CupE1/2/3/6
MRTPVSFPPGSRKRYRAPCAIAASLVALGTSTTVGALSCLSATVTATGPAFGTYTPLNVGNTYSNGSVSVTCFISTALFGQASASVTLSAGSSGSFSPRKMLSGTNGLNYNLYADSAYTQVWGDGTAGTSTVTDNFTFILTGGLWQMVTTPVYGQIPAQQLSVVPGSYLDTITVTVNY